MAKRDRLQIILGILNTCKRGANKTQIVYQANLNFRTVKPYLHLLEKNDLITIKSYETVLYITTPKGQELIERLTYIDEMLGQDKSHSPIK